MELTAQELNTAGLLGEFESKASSGFVAAQKLGLPQFKQEQLMRISKMLSQKTQGMSDIDIDRVILAQG